LHPNAAITPIRGTSTPFSRCNAVCFFIASRFSAWLRCRFFCVNASDAVSAIEPEIVSFLRKMRARFSPLALNQSAGETRDDVLGVRPTRHDARADERGGLDMVQPGLGERLDQFDLVRGADRAGLDLEALAWAFLMNVHMCRQIAHGLVPQ
jgi:hypothetical protein